MDLATWVSAEMDISFKSDRLKTSSLPSLFTAISCASAVATPPPLSPLPPLFVRLLFAISFFHAQSFSLRHPIFGSCRLISNMPVKGKVPRGVFEKLVWGLLAALSRSCQRVPYRSESRSKTLRSWMPFIRGLLGLGQNRVSAKAG